MLRVYRERLRMALEGLWSAYVEGARETKNGSREPRNAFLASCS